MNSFLRLGMCALYSSRSSFTFSYSLLSSIDVVGRGVCQLFIAPRSVSCSKVVDLKVPDVRFNTPFFSSPGRLRLHLSFLFIPVITLFLKKKYLVSCFRPWKDLIDRLFNVIIAYLSNGFMNYSSKYKRKMIVCCRDLK